MIIASLSDVHLSPYVWNSHRSIIGDAYYALGMITGELIKIRENMPAEEEFVLLLAGDIFDSTTPDPYTEKILQRNVEVLVAAGIQVFSVQGNHEFHAKVARASLFGTTPLTAEPVTVGGVTFCGIDYTSSTAELQEKVAAIPECNYLVMHAPFRHLLGFEDKYQIEKDDIPGHIDNVIVGDIHKQVLIQNKEGTRILSPGATHPRSITEIPGGHGVYIHKHETGMDQGDWVNVAPREFHEVTVLDEGDKTILRGITVNQAEGMLPPVIILKVSGEYYKEAMVIAEGKGALVVAKGALKVSMDKVDVGVQADIPTLMESLPLVIKASEEPREYSLLEQLLSTKDPASVLDVFRDNILQEAV